MLDAVTLQFHLCFLLFVPNAPIAVHLSSPSFRLLLLEGNGSSSEVEWQVRAAVRDVSVPLDGRPAGRPGFPSRRILFLLQDLPSVTCVASCRCGGSDRSDPESCRRQRRKTDHDKKFGSLLRKSHKNGVLGQQCVDQSVTSRP